MHEFLKLKSNTSIKMSLTSEAKKEVQRLLQLGEKLNAIRYLHLVNAVEIDPAPDPSAGNTSEPSVSSLPPDCRDN